MARILQIHVHYREQGGEDVVAEREQYLLEKNGHDVISARWNNATSRGRSAAQLLGYSWNPFSAREILSICDRVRPDVIHVHNTWFAISPSVLRQLRAAGFPVVVTLHNYRLVCANAQLLRDGAPCEKCVGRGPLPAIRHRCYRGSMVASGAAALGIQSHRLLGTWGAGVDRFLTLTAFSRDRFVAAGLPEDKLTVHPNLARDPGQRQNQPASSNRIVYVGRLSREKGLLEFFDAWRRAAPSGLSLVIVGEGGDMQELRRHASESVTFTGRLPRRKIDEILLDSRAVVYPSTCYEGQPLAVLEAFAAGVPVLGSDLGGLRDTLAPLGETWMIPPNDRTAWVNAVDRLRSNEFVNAGGEIARRTYEANHSPEVVGRKLEYIYQQLSPTWNVGGSPE